ncbi:hypothetical protein TGARI_369880 [Toxoplasma gondii ARI]|uniref:Uncharacterized protein n=1 Tax=Toxoplasma gondii ARI TaxID=1074872 RepID=A0A139XYL0_TOXGO|nr:hypothetical protein TGARI_369880 [Toxoplasma gondii ARI]
MCECEKTRRRENLQRERDENDERRDKMKSPFFLTTLELVRPETKQMREKETLEGAKHCGRKPFFGARGGDWTAKRNDERGTKTDMRGSRETTRPKTKGKQSAARSEMGEKGAAPIRERRSKRDSSDQERKTRAGDEQKEGECAQRLSAREDKTSVSRETGIGTTATLKEAAAIHFLEKEKRGKGRDANEGERQPPKQKREKK